eukprot:CAMPEP_0177276898 /NCGR_PEP_ID=MMETSP0367-20130122/68505_1 /TAXON_ID=447022 ORGANISM="Scrippsiella hangoei-like, Strain SHHI-4" /NCGR_SAMPLE_ID=MMETSP0367 /ASSEMBLY_ACC=CAM_ASM_000362 /LENGTH=411 /DNA_ID=CAMNT_0018733449 /DNA_START=32 /DNA_END=1263 /DNA_ORIENTATION=-
MGGKNRSARPIGSAGSGNSGKRGLRAQGKQTQALASRQTSRPPNVSFDLHWLWSEVSNWLPLGGGCRLGLRLVSAAAADAVIEELEAASDSVWTEDAFGGLLECLLRLPPLPRAAARAVARTAGSGAEGKSLLREPVRPLVDCAPGLLAWFRLCRRLPRLNGRRQSAAPSQLPAPRLLFGATPSSSSSVNVAHAAWAPSSAPLGEDVTQQMATLPAGTLVWLDGRLVLRNGFNSFQQLGRSMDGPWLLVRGRAGAGEEERRVCLQRFGRPEDATWLGEHTRLHGACALPCVEPRWSYIVNVSHAAQGRYLAELLAPRGCCGGGAEAAGAGGGRCSDAGEDMFEHTPLPATLGAAAHGAVVGSEVEEALLLRWSVVGICNTTEFVPVRVAVYGGGGSSLRCYDEALVTSHRR